MTDPSFARIVGQLLERQGAHRRSWNAYPTPCTVRMNRGSFAVLAELAADPGDVRVDDAAARVVAVAPHPVHQLVAA